MAILTDIVLPSIVVSIIISLIFGVNVLMLESSVETRVTQELQGFADLTTLVIQEEVRDVHEIVSLSQNLFAFKTANSDTVLIYGQGRDLVIERRSGTEQPNIKSHNVRLSELNFSTAMVIGSIPVRIRVDVFTESTPEEEVGNKTHRIKAYSSTELYLRNLNLN